MKVRNVTIGIKSEKELFDEVKEVWGKIERGEKVKKHEGIYFENLEAMRKAITQERLKIIKVIKKRRPSSIYELSKILERDTKNVSNDVNYLGELGLIELKKSKTGRGKTTPSVGYDKIILEISV